MQRNLTTPEFEHLHKLADRLGMAREDHAARNLAEYVALLEASGVSTQQIEVAMGVDSSELRTIRQDQVPAKSPAPITSNPHGFMPRGADVRSSAEIFELATTNISHFIDTSGLIAQVDVKTDVLARADARRNRHDIVVACGDQTLCRFDLEVRAIRRGLGWVHEDRMVSRAAFGAAELGDVLELYEPSIFHVCAHADLGEVHLVSDQGREIVEWQHFLDELKPERGTPSGVVLSICGSAKYLDEIVGDGIEWAIGVEGELPGECAQIFSQELYSRLGAFALCDAFCRAKSSIRPTYPEVVFQLRPESAAEWSAPWRVRLS